MSNTIENIPGEVLVTENKNKLTHIMCSILNDAPVDFSISLVEETKNSELPIFRTEGTNRRQYEYPVFALYKAYKENKLDKRYAVIEYNRGEFGHGMYLLVDCKTGNTGIRKMIVGIMGDSKIHKDIIEKKISWEVLKPICRTNGFNGVYIQKEHPSIDIEALLESSGIGCNDTHAPNGYYGMIDTEFNELTDGIKYLYINRKKSIEEILNSPAIKRNYIPFRKVSATWDK